MEKGGGNQDMSKRMLHSLGKIVHDGWFVEGDEQSNTSRRALLKHNAMANIIANLKFPALLDTVPVLGLAVWAVILLTAGLRAPDWKVMPETFKGTIFLLALVTAASLMPVEKLPAASWPTALGLG